MEALIKKTIRIVSYGIVATSLAFIGLLFAQRDGSQYSHLIPGVQTAHADAPVFGGDAYGGDGGGDGGGGGGGDDDDDDDDDDDS
jgi:hypothetical protein